ncbi:MAG: o-succinylbenzoate synthase [Anaerolineae bacterium]|uniref:o-succinylbenzoate synthase n=1 Tax=Promineifilum sp. TaxID=2664178 RepID=UPI001DE35114|nr:o-succinylbenzoate synthase [Anaerolineales bacterium]MCB8934185.1 o-succinylbenzoate synthase [Promineifilum sp.]MCO5179806.1 o-succinylbenzoate synthase [Promineifilum sp.]MCW5845634.1 o-succinylbenzoate synthase [Anaerolineae bacterium]
MKIERIDLYHVSMRLVSPFVTSFGPQQQRDCLLTAVHAEGLTGWGESVATNDPGYSYETTGTAWHILSDFLIPALIGRDMAGPEALGPALSFVRGHPLAKAALDQAMWDLAAQSDGISMSAKLAEPYAEGPKARVPVGVSIGIQPSLERTVEVIGEYYDQGYRRIKLKIKPGHDLAVARAARAAYPDLPIMLDANSAFRLEDAAVFQAMDNLDLLMLEQPLGYEDIYDHSRLRPLIKTPLCLDESIHSDDHARYALAIDACDIINVKPSRVAGWTEARRIHDRCRAAGMPLWVGGMLETGVGRAAQLALASLPGFTLPGDISATERYYERDITAPFYLNREDSTISVPSGVGLGVVIDHDYLDTVTVRRQSFAAH